MNAEGRIGRVGEACALELGLARRGHALDRRGLRQRRRGGDDLGLRRLRLHVHYPPNEDGHDRDRDRGQREPQRASPPSGDALGTHVRSRVEQLTEHP